MINKNANSKYPLLKEVAERWSPRSFSTDKIPDEEIMSLFDAARWAASSNNHQPWRFMWARKGTEAWDKIYQCLSDFNQQWVKLSTVLILTAYKKQFDNGKDNFHALHDLGLAVGNLSVQAQSLNIGVHQMAGVNWKKAHEIFEVPDGYHVTTAICLGYYGGDPELLSDQLKKSETSPRTRKDLNEIVKENQFVF